MSNTIWGSLKFRAGNAINSMLDWRYRLSGGTTSDITYVNAPRHKNVFVHQAKLYAMEMVQREANKTMSRFVNTLTGETTSDTFKQREAYQSILIERQKVQKKNWGTVEVTNQDSSKTTFRAVDRYGGIVHEAMILYYDTGVSRTFEEESYKNGKIDKISHSTTWLHHVDLCPRVSQNSSKNIVITPVQGRDYSRKELVSGGDVEFTVSGTIVSNEEGVYPDVAVKKFIQMMQYNGIINVSYFVFGEFNINKILVKSYSLGELEYKNEQPYSFTCVAVEPDEAVVITKDTITTLNYELASSPLNDWDKLVLRLKNKAADAIIDQTTGLAVQGTGIVFDKLVPNI